MAANREPYRRPRAGPALALGLLAAALAVIFRAELFAGSDLFFKAYRDVNPLTAWYPWSRLELASWREGLFPLWNPYNLLGHPLLANYQSAVFSVLLWPLTFGPFEWVVVPYLLARLVIAGWGTYLFCRRVGVGTAGSAAAGLAFGLTGYLVQYVNNEHIVIDILLPFLLLTGGRLARESRARWMLAHVAVTALVLLGGQPGAALFTLVLGYGYAIYIGFTVSGGPRGSALPGAILRGLGGKDRPRKGAPAARVRTLARGVARVSPILAAGSAAIIIALIQLLPFLEFLPRAWTFHTAAFGTEHLPLRGLVTLVAPGFYGPLDVANRHILLLRLAPYLGVVPAILAAGAALRPGNRTQLFFTAVMVTGLGLMAGLPPFAWLGRLPGLASLTFVKYTQPLAAFSAAVLAGHMVDELRAGRGRLRIAALAGALAIALLAASRVLGREYPELWTDMNGAALLAIVLAGSLGLVAVLSKIAGRSLRLVPGFILILILIDLVFASAPNHPFMFENMAKKDMSAFREIIKDDPLARVAATPDALLPNQNLLVPFFSIDVHDALNIRDSMKVYSDLGRISESEVRNLFYLYHSLRYLSRDRDHEQNRIWNIGHLVSAAPLKSRSNLILYYDSAKVLAPSKDRVFPRKASLNDDVRGAVFAHPPSRLDLSAALLPEHAREFLDPEEIFSAGIDPASWSASRDGVWFEALTRHEQRDHMIWARHLDPGRRREERKWIDFKPLAGAFSLVTLPGNSPDNDWALWANGPFDRYLEDNPEWRLSRTHGYYDYHDPQPLPRAAILHGPPATTAELTSAVKTASAFPDATISSYGLQAIVCQTRTSSAASLVFSDAYYPGWKAFVNGHETKIIKTIHGVRGVEVPAGDSVVEFVYQPASFRVGLWASVVTLAASVCAAVFISRQGAKTQRRK